MNLIIVYAKMFHYCYFLSRDYNAFNIFTLTPQQMLANPRKLNLSL